ncbi:tyrosyl-DNA phosphodiesterase-domain-containing protein [Xylaria nigripes]|nr:tyrosyl-DNA phosphodiesterase-domain-containing protein [Xylaria nigripes]
MDSTDDPFAGDEDAALRYAIELSLQDLEKTKSPSTTQKKTGPKSEGNEEDEQEHGPKSPSKRLVQSSGTFTSLGLDRKKMEEERLARVAKRKAPPDDEIVQQGPQRRVKIDGQPNARIHVSATAQSLPIPYPKGIVRKTWAYGYPRQDDIKIEEIFQKHQLELAILSSFVWDDTWLLSKIDITKTKMICVAFASNEAHKEEMRANVPKDRIRFCFPPMMPSGTMHSKLQLLKFPNYLRLVIPTGNLVPYDWGEGGIMENMVFLIDLPIAQEATKPLTDFGQELCYFLKACGLDKSLIESLEKYDFSETGRYRFIHTIGQSHVGSAWQRTGYCGLGRAVKSLGLATQSRVKIDFVSASLGSLKSDFISAIYGAAQGDDGLREYERRTRSGGRKVVQSTDSSYHPDDFRIYFPSHDTVSQSRGGTQNGGTICLTRAWWDSPTFPRELVCDCQSVRSGLLMHNKLLFVRRSDHGTPQTSWAYVGSANLSESAWGRLVKDRASQQPKLNCRNWECGVLIPMEGESAEPGLKAFENRIPVPMIVPSEAYGKTHSKRPWCQSP